MYIKVGRRSLVPFTTIWSMLSFLQAGMEEEAMKSAAIILERLQSSKKNWGRQDKVAFTLFKRHIDYSNPKELKIKSASPRQWPLLDICEAQVQIFRTNYWMNETQAVNLVQKLLTEEKARETTADELVRMHWIMMDLYWHVGKTEDAWKSYDAALALESEQTKTKKGELYGTGYGVIPVMHVNAATIHFNSGNLAEAKASLAKVKPYNNKYTLNPLTQVKGTVMRKNLGLEFEGNFRSIKISSGRVSNWELSLKGENLRLKWGCYNRKRPLLQLFHTSSSRRKMKSSTSSRGISTCKGKRSNMRRAISTWMVGILNSWVHDGPI